MTCGLQHAVPGVDVMRCADRWRVSSSSAPCWAATSTVSLREQYLVVVRRLDESGGPGKLPSPPMSRLAGAKGSCICTGRTQTVSRQRATSECRDSHLCLKRLRWLVTMLSRESESVGGTTLASLPLG